MVHLVKADGLVQGQDFDFKWHPAIDDWMNGNRKSSYVEFYFYKEEYATIFALKYT